MVLHTLRGTRGTKVLIHLGSLWLVPWLLKWGVGFKTICDLITLLAHGCPYYSRREGFGFRVCWLRFFSLLIEVALKLVLALKGEKEKKRIGVGPKVQWFDCFDHNVDQQIHSKTEENAPFLGHWNKQQRGVFNFGSILWCSQKWQSSIGRFSQIWLWMRYGSLKTFKTPFYIFG